MTASFFESKAVPCAAYQAVSPLKRVDDDYSRKHMERFRLFASEFGEFVNYEHDRGARDIGITFSSQAEFWQRAFINSAVLVSNERNNEFNAI